MLHKFNIFIYHGHFTKVRKRTYHECPPAPIYKKVALSMICFLLAARATSQDELRLTCHLFFLNSQSVDEDEEIGTS